VFESIHSGLCASGCAHSSECGTGDTCVNLVAVGIDTGLCVPHGAWRPGNAPQDVRHTGLVALELYALVGMLAALGMVRALAAVLRD
jgi:hypothetical protein